MADFITADVFLDAHGRNDGMFISRGKGLFFLSHEEIRALADWSNRTGIWAPQQDEPMREQIETAVHLSATQVGLTGQMRDQLVSAVSARVLSLLLQQAGEFQDEPEYRKYAQKSYHAREDEAPRFQDMAYGTTFDLVQRDGTKVRYMKTSDGGVIDQDGTWWSQDDYEKDISRGDIRNVTPPTEAPRD